MKQPATVVLVRMRTPAASASSIRRSASRSGRSACDSGRNRHRLHAIAQLPAGLRSLIEHDHGGASGRRLGGCDQACRTRAHDHNRRVSWASSPLRVSPSPRWIRTSRPAVMGVRQAGTFGMPSTTTMQSRAASDHAIPAPDVTKPGHGAQDAIAGGEERGRDRLSLSTPDGSAIKGEFDASSLRQIAEDRVGSRCEPPHDRLTLHAPPRCDSRSYARSCARLIQRDHPSPPHCRQ